MKEGTEQLEPTTIVIFGATGDLSRKKLIPSLMDLYSKGYLPKPVRIVGFSRREFSHDEYRTFMRDIIDAKEHQHSKETIESFLNIVFYQQGNFDDLKAYEKLGVVLDEMDSQIESCPNRLFYLAVPPKFYETIFDYLCESSIGKRREHAWTRILVEKPFGNDFESAQKLDAKLGTLFNEEQIYRIDHYLAKDAVQNILTFRFANSIFQRSWDAKSIERVHIRLAEDFGVEERAGFYDGIGALRDVGQNHMLQMLALIAMENPGTFEAVKLRENRAAFLKSLRCYTEGEVGEQVTRGQYKGYRDIEGVEENSDTETYFRVTTFIENDRWQDVPFILESGKCLNETKTEIRIVFTPPESCLCNGSNLNEYQNQITIGIKPTQAVSIRFWGKKPGLTYELEPQDLHFECNSDEGAIPEAYEKVLYDALVGDQTLFTSTQEVEAAWKFITPILKGWDKTPLHSYSVGSEGPKGNDQ